MTTIWKYELSLSAVTELEIPSLYADVNGNTVYKASKQALYFGLQNETPTVWVMVNPEAPRHKLTIRLVGTGQACPTDGYIGTVVMFDGNLVLHAFTEEH